MAHHAFPKPELLAPAGSREALEAVTEAGADAVYLSGKRFAMRQHAHWLNFDDEALRAAAGYLHARGRRMYITLNNLYTDAELALLPEYLDLLVEIGADALIVTDYGLIRLLGSRDSRIPLFASVMMQIHSAEGVRELQRLGVRRIVASQHMPLEAIRRIKEATGIEVEHFIHGDVCSAIHSFCTHSGIATGELSGRGKCMKSCRWSWDFVSIGEGKVLKPLEEDIHALARKDLCLYKQVPRLIQAGMTSFKIEGRARPGNFLRPIVRAYRELIDSYCADPASYVYEARVFRSLNEGRIRDFSAGRTFGNPAREASGLTGEREPRFFSLGIEEKGIDRIEEEEFAAQARSIDGFPDSDSMRPPTLTVRCGTLESALAALESGADRILVGGEVATGRGQRWTVESLGAAAAAARSRQKQALLATPRMTTEAQVEEYRWLLGRLAPEDWAGIHVHNVGMLAVARESTPIPVHADFTFNTFNAGAAAMLGEMGAAQATLSPEATMEQVAAIRGSSELPLELIIHGSLPGMLIEQCLVAALTLDASADDPCPAPCQALHFGLRDKVGQVHPIETDQYCRNHLLMGKDMCTLGHLEPILRIGLASLRLEVPYSAPELAARATAIYRLAIDRFFAQGRRGPLLGQDEFEEFHRAWPRPLSLGGLANAFHPISVPDGEMPTNLLIQYG